MNRTLPFCLVAAVCLGAGAAEPELRPATAARVLEEVRRPGASAVLLNVWATWCLPCREEFPDLVRLARELAPRGVRLVLVSADFDDDRETQVRRFLVDHKVDFPSFLKEGPDGEFIDALEPRWSGALPLTVIYDADGRARDLWEGARSYDVIQRKVLAILETKAVRHEEER